MRDTPYSGAEMSFGDNVKSELLSALPQRTCCRRSYLHGLLINAENGVAGMVMCRIKGEKTAETVKKLLLEQYGRAPETRNENCYGRAVCVFEFESKRLAAFLEELSDLAHISDEIPELKCPECRGAFAAGVIAAAARFCDPQKAVRMEIGISDPVRAERAAAFFAASWSAPALSFRSGCGSVIFKKSQAVQDILSEAGAPMAAMELIQGDLLREFRGNINRASNCEVRNIGRSVSAAAIQLEAIRLLREAGSFEALPEDLRETAELREKEPECSIAELAGKHSPPISKSGANHRLRRICDAAENLKK